LEFPVYTQGNTRDGVLEGHFFFLNESFSLGRPVDWTAPSKTILWRFNLHYFHYLHVLERREQVALCREWIGSNPLGEGIGWHPYPTSLRIVNWCRAGFDDQELLKSLYQQAAYLYRNLETHVYGNHLLENARALVLAGAYLQGQGEANQWLRRGLSIYREQTPEQVLPDGLHFERSPMYHALMLEGYLDVLNVLPNGHPDRAWLIPTAKTMVDGLAGVTHPDGQIALFNDSTLEIAPPPKQLLDYAKRMLDYSARPRHKFPETGYFVHASDAMWMMIDAGPAGPDYLMAHAHADVFSYELSLFGKRFMVDSGVYEYPAGPMRQYVRSTAAHNTVSVDGADQIECWDSFRVARRAAPHDVAWHVNSGGAQFEGTFSGYADVIGDDISHRRRIQIDEARRTIDVHDSITGGGEHRVKSYVHLHPAVDIERDGEGVLLQRDGKDCRLTVTAGRLRCEKGWYCPRFGVRHRNCVLVIEEDGSLPMELRYRVQY